MMPDHDDKNCSVIVDLDGTLNDIFPSSDAVTTPADLVPLLAHLWRGLHVALAIISGLREMDVDRLLVALKLVTAGVHGGELRDTLNSEVHFMASPLGPALVGAVRELSLLHPGVVVEAKDSAITVHYRLAPAVEPQIATALRPLLEGTPCTITHCKGRRFFEVVSKHVSKGPHSRRSMISHRFADASPS